MFRKDISQFLIDKKNSIIYIGSSNKNIDIYFDNIKEQEENIIKLSDLQDEEEYYKTNYELLERINNNKKIIILTSLEGILAKYSLNKDVLNLKLGNGIARKKLIDILERNGYQKNYLVQKRLEFSVRGDIIDIFPLSGENPIRIEFFGDEIDRITYFSISDQKSFEKISTINIYINKNSSQKLNFLELLKKLEENRK
ncbi:MAG: transcription-repair coupling factor, partial [Cetobacterium sp.]